MIDGFELATPILEPPWLSPWIADGPGTSRMVHPDVAALAGSCWPVNQWCYRETLAPHGWLTEDQVVRKQAELSRTMWAVEYELQEPSAEGRAIDPPAVERMFDATLGTHIPAGDLAHTWRGQSGPPAERAWPDPAGAWYCIGVDWAQKRRLHRRRRRALRYHAAPGRRRLPHPTATVAGNDRASRRAAG